jgi:hypothetical protein
MTPDELYRAYLVALLDRNYDEQDRLLQIMMDAPDTDEGDMTLEAIARASDEYIALRFPDARRSIGDLAATSEDGLRVALLLERIVFGSPEID